MAGVIIHCPQCGGALMVTPRVTEARVHNTPHNKSVMVAFAHQEVEHECADE